jgi:hypothetical protein
MENESAESTRKRAVAESETLQRPNRLQVLTAGLWLLLTAAVIVDFIESRSRPPRSSLACVVLESTVKPSDILDHPPRPPVPLHAVPRAPSAREHDQEREKKRQELLNESTLAWQCGPSPFGILDAFLSIVPCWLLFLASAVLVLMNEAPRAVGNALGGWTIWIWGSQTTLLEYWRWG